MGQNKSIDKNISKETTDCYACMDHLWSPMNVPDCLLCKAPHGEGWGKLYKEFRMKVVTVTDKNGRTVTFNPPSYTCVLCKDTKQYKYWVKDPNVLPGTVADGHPSIGNEPEEMACHRCMKSQYEIDNVMAQQKYLE
ncbi:MAG: hypothetical protein Edafosvirus1_27 [Edafosvirus sp.]|uniref:Uncharacterized protein n=1 Tax=Edafosvirus sp. TaxID=2487765 RepID=A0A3G4ZS05_9VIRU|nr:MAG: hypothetical protein Edafosvirus1_27 [Edafosvirus sp.]